MDGQRRPQDTAVVGPSESGAAAGADAAPTARRDGADGADATAIGRRLAAGTGAVTSAETPPPDGAVSGAHVKSTSRLRILDVGDSMGARRGECVLCIPVYGADDAVAECLHSVLRHTPPSVALLVADDASPAPFAGALLAELDSAGVLDRDVVLVRAAVNRGFVRNVNAAMRMAAPADVVVLNSDCVVTAGWYEGLRDAAYSDTTAATATALSNHATIVSIPYGKPVARLAPEWTVDAAAAAIRAASLRLHPHLPTAVGHCMYIRRDALDLVGEFDEAFSPGYGEEVDFSQRCLRRGLTHILADDVFVFHQGTASFQALGDDARTTQAAHERMLEARYPYYAEMVRELGASATTPLARAVGIARRALCGLSVTIDATCLGPVMTGTQVQVLELVNAVNRSGDARVRVVVPRDVSAYARARLRDMDGVEMMYLDEVRPGLERTEVVHRAYQVTSSDDLITLALLGHRLVISQLDLIAYRNPAYFRDYAQWRGYQSATADALAAADMVFFLSDHARDGAIGDGLVDTARARVVPPGIDHQVTGGALDPEPPADAECLTAAPFLLCLGTDFHHKNRVFALDVVRSLQERHGWKGRLVLVGARVGSGSSAGAEARYLMAHPRVDEATTRVATVDEAQKQWLVHHAAAVIYPTTTEGFGLIPFEAARAGVPTVFAARGSLAEILPADAARLVPWDADATADNVLTVTTDAAARQSLVDTITTAGRKFRWETSARQAIDAYCAAADAPSRRRMQDVDLRVSAVTRSLLLSPQALPGDIQQALWAISRRRALSTPFYGGLRLFHRLSRQATGRDRRPKS